MALKIERPQPPVPQGMVADRRLYLSGDKARLLEEGNAAAAYLLAPAGRVIPAAEVHRLGLSLVDGRVVQGPPAPPPKPPKEK